MLGGVRGGEGWRQGGQLGGCWPQLREQDVAQPLVGMAKCPSVVRSQLFRRLRWQNLLAVGCPSSREGEETRRMQFGLESYSGTAAC